MTLKQILERLHARRNGSGWQALCPAHADKNPSLSIDMRDGKVLLHCHAGCAQEAVLAAAGIEPRELFLEAGERPIVAEYNYTDESGKVLFQVVRFEPKDFRQRRPDGSGSWTWKLGGVRRVLYRLAEVVAGKSVLLVEGEKDVESARKLRFVATCNSGGAGKWRPEYSECLRGKKVVIITDADEPGRLHAQQVAASLFGKVELLKVLELPGVKDLTEWLEEKHGTKEALLELIKSTQAWLPASSFETRSVTAGANVCVLARCMENIRPEPLKWLWPGRIPLGKVSLVVGDPGLGKSLLTLDIAARLSMGKNFPDGAISERGMTVLLSAEDDAGDTIRPRLDAARADVSRIHLLEAVRCASVKGSVVERSFSLESDIGALEELVARLVGVRLIVVDPISAYLGRTESNTNSEVRGLLAPLAALAAKHRVGVVGVTHLRKSDGKAVHRAISSIGFVAAARAVWAVAPDPNDSGRRLFLPVKQNLAAEQGGLSYRIEAADNIARIRWEPGTVTMTADDVLGATESVEERTERQDAAAWLRDLLSNGPVAVVEIEEQAKKQRFSWATIRRAAKVMEIEKKKSGFGSGWAWSLPDRASREDAHIEDAHPLPEQVSTFGNVIEFKEEALLRTHEDAHTDIGEHLRPTKSGFDEGEI